MSSVATKQMQNTGNFLIWKLNKSILELDWREFDDKTVFLAQGIISHELHLKTVKSKPVIYSACDTKGQTCKYFYEILEKL